MNVRTISHAASGIAAGMVMMVVLSAQLVSGEVHKLKSAQSGSAQLPNPFQVFSSCPPAVCVGYWDGLSDPASGSTNFAPAGIPEQFSFVTGNPVAYYCIQQYSSCHADYDSGTFTATGPAGTFHGLITSGYADEEPTGWEISVTFTGHWSDGRFMTGSADERYSEAFQVPDTRLDMKPAN